MEKDDVYYFHQTPCELCKKLISEVPLVEGDKVLEPFRGEG
jgi:DNA modification methylase